MFSQSTRVQSTFMIQRLVLKLCYTMSKQVWSVNHALVVMLSIQSLNIWVRISCAHRIRLVVLFVLVTKAVHWLMTINSLELRHGMLNALAIIQLSTPKLFHIWNGFEMWHPFKWIVKFHQLREAISPLVKQKKNSVEHLKLIASNSFWTINIWFKYKLCEFYNILSNHILDK